ncbi:MAG TPA: TadE family protein [Tianweitania sediminis]|nr:TadE family protein [Tianweitania sediminis]
MTRDKHGVSAVEFALVAPIFLLLLAGTVEIGGMMFTRFQLNSAISAGATYSVLNGSTLSATTANTVVTNTAAVVAGNTSSQVAVAVTINNGYTRTVSGGQAATSGSASQADQCYCPTRSGATLTWGATTTCEASCPNGSLAGKFIMITATKPYQSMFGGFSLVEDGQISVATMAQVK